MFLCKLLLSLSHSFIYFVSFSDEDMQGFIELSTGDKCIESNRADLRKDPDRIMVTNNGQMEEKIYEGMNKTHHYLCAEHRNDGPHVTSDLCVVPFDEQLYRQDQLLNGTHRERNNVINGMYKKFCNLEADNNSVSVKLVESSDQCKNHVVMLQIILSSVINTKIVVYISNVVATIGLIGNFLALSIFLSKDYQQAHKTCIYFVAKTTFESMHLVLTMWYTHSLVKELKGNKDKYLEALIHGALKLMVVGGRHWMVTIISIEQCLAVKKPFLARQYLRKSTSIKVTVTAVIVDIMYTTTDVLIQYFFSGKILTYETNLRFVTKEAKIILHTVGITYIVPWSIAFICTVLTAIGLKRAMKRRAAMTQQTAGQNSQQNPNWKNDFLMTRIIMFSLISVIISNIPIIMEYVLLIVFETEMIMKIGKGVDIIILVAIFCHLVGNSLDFYLFLVSNRDFRGQFIKNFLSVVSSCRPHD